MATVVTTIYRSRYETVTKGSVGPMNDLDRLLAKVEKRAADLERRLDGLGSRGLPRVGEGAGRATPKLQGFISKLGAMRIAIAALGLGALAASVITIGARFEQLGVQLETVFGARGVAVFERLRETAATTPFTLDQITESAIRLKAVGLEPTERLLRSIGDTAAAFGRDISQFSQAVIQATVGEMEMLKQFGIIARQQGDIVRFTFKGVTTEVGKNADEIVEFLTRLGETEFAGAMEKQALTLTGRFSTLKDAGAELATTFFDLGAGGAAKEIVSIMTKMIGLATDAAQEWSEFATVLREEFPESAQATVVILETLSTTANQIFTLLADRPRQMAREAAVAISLLADSIRLLGKLPGVETATSVAELDKLAVRLLKVSAAGREAADGLDETKKATDEEAEAAASAAEKNKENREEVQGLTKALKDVQARIKDAEKAQKDETKAVRESSTAFRDAQKLREEEIELQEKLRESVEDSTAALRAQAQHMIAGLGFLTGAGAGAPGAAAGVDFGEPGGLGEGMEEAVGKFDGLMKDVAIRFGRIMAAQFDDGGPIHETAFALFETAAVAIGQAFGGPVGGAVAGIFASLVKGIFSKGADEAFAQLEVVDGQLQVVSRTIEGDLRPALASLTDSIRATVNSILAEFGGALVSGEFGVKIRNEGEGIVRVFWGGVVTEFEDEAAAASFLVAKILSTSLIEGLGASVQEALKGSTFESTEELLAALRFGEGIDAALRTPWEQFVAEVGAQTRVQLGAAGELGISLERVTEAERRRIQALVDEHAALILSTGGVQSFLGEWEKLQEAIAIAGPEGVAKLEAELLSAAEAAIQQAAAVRESGAAAGANREQFGMLFEGFGLGEERMANLRERFDELVEAGVPAEEIVAELVTSLKGVSSAQVQQALSNFRQNFVVGLLGQLASLADLAGKGALAENLRARALKLSTQMQFLSIRATLQAARAAGLISDEQTRGFLATLREIKAAMADLGPVRRPGGGGGAGPAAPPGRTPEQALADLERLMQQAADTLAGVTVAERQRLDVLAQLDADLAAGLLTPEKYAEAIAKLDAVMQLAADTVAENVTAKWEELGRVLGETPLDTQLRQLWASAVADMGLGAEGVPEAFGLQVAEWFRGALADADTPEAFAAIATSWTEFLDTLPADIRAQLEASGIGAEIAAGIEGSGIAQALAARSQLASTAGNLLGFLDDFYAGAFEGEALRQAQLEINFAIRRAQLEVEFAMLTQALALGQITAAQFQAVAEAMAVIRGATPDFAALAAGAGSRPVFRGGARGGATGAAGKAADELARLRDELDAFLKASERAELDPLERELADIFDRFARMGEILQTLNASTEEWGRTAQDMAAELVGVWNQARDDVQELLSEIRGNLQGPAGSFVEARATFRGLAAGLPSDLSELSPDQIRELVAAGRAFRESGKGIFGEGFGAGIVDRELEALLKTLEGLAPTEEDLLLQAIQHLQEQNAIELKKIGNQVAGGLGASGRIALAIGSTGNTLGGIKDDTLNTSKSAAAGATAGGLGVTATNNVASNLSGGKTSHLNEIRKAIGLGPTGGLNATAMAIANRLTGVREDLGPNGAIAGALLGVQARLGSGTGSNSVQGWLKLVHDEIRLFRTGGAGFAPAG